MPIKIRIDMRQQQATNSSMSAMKMPNQQIILGHKQIASKSRNKLPLMTCQATTATTATLAKT